MNFDMESDPKQIIHDLFYSEKYNSLPTLLDRLRCLLHCKVRTIKPIDLGLIDLDLFEEVRRITARGHIPIYFGKSLCDIKCVILDDDGLREHEIFIQYKGPRKLVISDVKLPFSPLQEKVYTSLEEIAISFKRYVDSLACYLYELERIDRFCTVVEPVNSSFKDDYRRILLDDRTWLHIEVTLDGLATNIHLLGHSEPWQDKLQAGLLAWDHDKDIVENIMIVFDLVKFPVPATESPNREVTIETPLCSICLCVELPNEPSVPQPLCQNSTCGVYYHRNCLFQWLVACAGGRPPALGVATGSCPTCLQPINCTEKDN